MDATKHWTALLERTYLRCCDLNNYPALIEITEIRQGVELTMIGGVKKPSTVVYYKMLEGRIVHSSLEQKKAVGQPKDGTCWKPLVLNYTNTKSIAKICGGEFDVWPGKKVVLYPSETSFQGEMVPAIRVRAPKEKADV